MEEQIINENLAENQGKTSFWKNKKLVVLLIAIIVLFVAAIVAGGFVFFSQNITGAWELTVNPELPQSTVDEIPESEKVYYIFDKADRYGRGEWHLCYQSGVEYGKYELMEEDSVEKINLGTENLEYRITGAKLFGSAKLTIIYPEYTDETTGITYEAQEYIFEQAKDPKYEKQSYKDFKTDSALVGEKWTSNERTLSYYYYLIPYVETVEFTSDGIMVIHYQSEQLMLDRYMYYAYTVEDSELTFSPVTDKDKKYTVVYEFDEDDNLKFIDDTTSGSMFADAFFGEFTFYTVENLPEPTQASADEMYLIE